jgi:Major Facilitator Superfamily
MTLVNSFGTGLFITISVLFFTRSVGLTVAQVGLGLGVAGIFGMMSGPAMGWLADRWGARTTMALLLTADGVGILSYVLVHSLATFLPLACAVTIVDRGATAVRGSLIVHALPASGLARSRGYLRATMNVGMGAGAALAAIALQAGTRGAYLVIVVIDAATYLAAASLLLRLRSHDGRGGQPPGTGRRPRPARRGALTDRPYLLVTALNGVLSLQFGILQIGIPLWVIQFTRAPRWIISAVLVLNTVLVAVLQVRASRGIEQPQHAASICARAGLLLALACITYGFAQGVPALMAVAILLTGAILSSLGEILSTAAAWTLSYELADPSAHGMYQGVFTTGVSAGMLMSAPILANTAIRFGLPGWLALAVFFSGAGAALIPATRWALGRNRARATT